MCKNNFKIVFTFIGTFIGAGFASGREIALFFGEKNILVPLLSAVICGVLSFVFMELGRVTKGELTKFLFPKTFKVWEILLCLSNFIIFSAMLAGAEFTARDATGYIGGGIISGLLAATIVIGGMEKIKAANFIAVPLIICMCLIMFILEPKFEIKGTFNLINPLLYAAMNILSCGLLASKLSFNNTRKQSLICSIMITATLSLLIVLVYLLINGRENEAMPLLDLAKSLNLGFVGNLLILMAILTTMIGSLSLASGNKPIITVALLCAGYAVSTLGFKTIVDTAYPVIGVLGMFVSVAAIIRLVLHYAKPKRIMFKRRLKMIVGGDII